VSGQIPRLLRSIALVVAALPVLGISVGTPVDAAPVDDCLAAPNSPSPPGRHWYYKLDWDTQRKCWYLRAPARRSMSPASRSRPAAESAPTSMSSDDAGSLPSEVKVPADNPTAAPALESNPLQNTSSESHDQAAESGGAVVVWPDPPPVVATNNEARRTSVFSGEPSNNGKIPTIAIFLILALGLAVAALLARLVQNVTARRALAIDDQSRHEWRGDQGDDESVDEKRALVSALSRLGSLGSDNVSFPTAYEISKRKNKLAQLHQNLDRLLQSPTPA
jgi:hypothetical protein